MGCLQRGHLDLAWVAMSISRSCCSFWERIWRSEPTEQRGEEDEDLGTLNIGSSLVENAELGIEESPPERPPRVLKVFGDERWASEREIGGGLIIPAVSVEDEEPAEGGGAIAAGA